MDRNEDYGRLVVAALHELSMRAKHTRTVDEFLDLNCRTRVDLVSLEVEPCLPHTIESLRVLRTHFGEGPGTRIIASSCIAAAGFELLVERHGADACINHRLEPNALAAWLNAELQRKKIASVSGEWVRSRSHGEARK
ncbi:MAG: hypothetical protein AAGA74_19170 [Pseudomonadota bacterium]